VRARARDTVRGGAQPRDYGLPAVRINLVRCSITAIRTASVTLERCLVSAIRPASFTLERNIVTAEVANVQTRTIRSALRFAAYADDLVVVVTGNSRRELETQGQCVVDIIMDWCRFAKLQISERKTEAIVLKSDVIARNPIGRRGGARPDRKRKTNTRTVDFGSRPPIIRIGNSKIGFKETVRYLGVHIDKGLKVRSHCAYLNSKVGLLFDKLGRLAKA